MASPTTVPGTTRVGRHAGPAAPGRKTAVSIRLTPQGWLAMGASFGFTSALIWQSPIPWSAFFGFALMAALLVSLTLLPRRLRRVGCRWILPPTVHATEDVTVGCWLSADRPTPPLTLTAWDPGAAEHGYVADLAGVQTTRTRVAWVTRFPQRGTIDLPGCRIQSEQPFGLVLGEATPDPDGATLTVYPAIGRLRHGIEEDLLAWIADGCRSREVGDDELAHLRPYRHGDPPRKIHWRASARTGNLMVTERQDPVARRLAILVDCQTSPRNHKWERIVAAAATLVDHLLARGWTLSLHATSLPPEGLVGDRDHLMTGLANLQADHQAGIDERIPPGVACLALLLEPRPLPNSRLLRTWLPEQLQSLIALPRMAR